MNLIFHRFRIMVILKLTILADEESRLYGRINSFFSFAKAIYS